MTEPPSAPQGAPPPWRPRFGIGGMMLVTLVCCVTASAAYYMAQLQTRPAAETSAIRLGFVLFTLAAPMLVLIVVSALWSASKRRRR